MIHYLTNPTVVTSELLQTWNVDQVLSLIATAQPPFHSLIDTGALITGKTNFQVAEYLLDHGLVGMEGVVFLNDEHKKMVLVRQTRRVMPLALSGISEEQRFAFYDDVHTTGYSLSLSHTHTHTHTHTHSPSSPINIYIYIIYI